MILDKFNSNKSFHWHSGDTEEHWVKNRKRFGPSWNYYNGGNVEYNYNSLGYRSPEITDIHKDFFISFGCSHTVGIGLAVKETYSHILSNELDLQYLNFAIGGGAQNVVWCNSTLWLKNYKQKPKFVILQWPETERLTLYKERINLFLPNWHGDDYTTRAERNMYLYMLQNEDYLYSQASMYFYNTNLLWNLAGVKTVNFTLAEKTSELFDIHCFRGWSMDESLAARDCVHPGPSHNREMAEFIKAQL